ncbi:MAG: hypothetical protein RJA49_2768 [Actinomycetota bacterium]|jgi:hypothetical protein
MGLLIAYVCPTCSQRIEARCSQAWCGSPAHSTRTVRMIPVEHSPTDNPPTKETR